jgi:hypothetical protein
MVAGGGSSTTTSCADKDYQKKKNSQPECTIAAAELTKRINILRVVALLLLVSIAAGAAFGIYRYTENIETERFEQVFEHNAQLVIDAFQTDIQHKLGAIASLADAITSHALFTGETFPRVTLPHFEVHGSNMRIQAEALIVHWMPLVTDETRLEWEEYAMEKRGHIDTAFDEDARLRQEQDARFGLVADAVDSLRQKTEEEAPPNNSNLTVLLQDGSNFHPRIWSNGAVVLMGDEIAGSGPYLPLWQRR